MVHQWLNIFVLSHLQHENGSMHIITLMLPSEGEGTTLSATVTPLSSNPYKNYLQQTAHNASVRSASITFPCSSITSGERGHQAWVNKCFAWELRNPIYYLNTIWALLTRKKVCKTAPYLSPKLILTPRSL